ncbi:MAG: hypothetical protein EBU96_06430 [Actinobacteria bacterium]|nr:hypothetical protein [Actinomycetota bacterium]
MLQEMSEAVVAATSPGECRDLYYPGHENTEKSCFPSYVENRFNLSFPSLTAGSSSTLIFNPQEGQGDIVITFQFYAADDYTGLGLAQSWGYRLIRELQVRPAGGSQYTFTGDQLFLAALSDCEDSVKKDMLSYLGGQSCVSEGDFANQAKLTAYVYLKLPWNTPSAQEKTLPWPTDLVTQPLTLIVTLDSFDKVFYRNPNVEAPSPLPTALKSANCNFRQTHMTNSQNLLARRADMVRKALSYPLPYFSQTTFRATVPVNQPSYQINLTGLRSGSVKSLDIWAVRTADYNSGNGGNWVALQDTRLLISGTVYYDAVSGSQQLWSLLDRKTPAMLSTTVVSPDPNNVQNLVATPVSAVWTNIPLGQHTERLAGENIISGGLNIANSVMNLSFNMPTINGAGAGETWTISIQYNYLASMLFNAGSVDYIF